MLRPRRRPEFPRLFLKGFISAGVRQYRRLCRGGVRRQVIQELVGKDLACAQRGARGQSVDWVSPVLSGDCCIPPAAQVLASDFTSGP